MSETRTKESAARESTASALAALRDPLLLKATAGMFGTEGRAMRRRAQLFTVLAGVVDGAALIALLPATSSLSTGEPVWGLRIGGWIAVIAVLAVLGAVSRYPASLYGYRSTLTFMRAVQQMIGDALASLPLGWFRADRTGGLSRLVSDGLMAAGNAFAHVVSLVIANVAALAVIVVGSWFWDFRLGLVLTIAAPVTMAVMILAQTIRRKASESVRPSDRELANRIVEYASCQPALRAAGRSANFEPLRRAADDNDRARRREMWLSMVALVCNGIVVQAIAVTLISVAAALVVGGALGPIETIAFIGITLRFTRILEEVGESFVGIDMGRAPVAEAAEILYEPILPEPAPDRSAAITAPGEVALEGVTFSYDGGRPVLRDVSFTAAPGTVTAIVGPSGSGKTTIARLISRFWDVDEGTVRVGGPDVREQTIEQLMSQLSMVFQDVYLFDDTLEANIRVGREDAPDDEVRAAADLAGVTDIADRLPDGWRTRVGEGGRSLSGGERQRVSIARALLKQSPIVLFDEATSALDAENEANVLASMEKLRDTSTFIVIAHKLDTIRSADRIIVLAEDGSVAETGTHDELFAAGGPYRAFWDRREAATGWALVPEDRS